MINSEHKKIDAEQLLAAKFSDAKTDYQHGWNDALQAAYDVEAKQKIAHWESVGAGSCMRYCSCCHTLVAEHRIQDMFECPNCGAEMVEYYYG